MATIQKFDVIILIQSFRKNDFNLYKNYILNIGP